MHEQKLMYDKWLDELVVVSFYMNGKMCFEGSSSENLIERLNIHHDMSDDNEVLKHAGFEFIDYL